MKHTFVFCFKQHICFLPSANEAVIAAQLKHVEGDTTQNTIGVIKTPIVGGGASASVSACFANVKPDITEDNIYLVMPHVVVRFPDKYLHLFLARHYKNLPDLSAGIQYTPDDLCFWKNKDVLKKIQKFAAHGTLPGFCCKWANTSYDFAMARLENTHLSFQTHIWLFKHTFGFSNTHLAF